MIDRIKNHIKVCNVCKELILFFIGGLLYIIIELLWRGRSHWTMFILGGLCFIIIGALNNFIYTYKDSLIKQMLVSSFIITLLEFISGVILNIFLNLNVWDYSNMPCNLLGQVCLPFSILWVFLSLAAIILDDYIRYYLFDEEKPHYNFF